MKVIGAGLPRTGTMSTQAALNLLGYNCYHMQNVMKSKEHIKMWNDLISEKKPMDWKRLFSKYQATVDAPACFFFDELLREFPDAKVVLTVRDPDRWYNSFSLLLKIASRFRKVSCFIPMLKNFMNMAYRMLDEYMPLSEIENDHVKYVEGHNNKVKSLVPSDKLLIFRVQEGWEPLCSFLNCEVPVGVPFPHLNEGGNTLKKMFLRIIFSRKIVYGFISAMALFFIASIAIN